MKLFYKQLHKKKNGFTLMELLIVVAIIVVLLALSVPAVASLRRSLRQRELDSKAEVIYVAAQSRLTQLRTGGFSEIYSKDGKTVPDSLAGLAAGTVINGHQVRKDILPTDADNGEGQADDLCYVVSEEGADSAAYLIMPDGSMDENLWKNNWIIEFDPETGTVYAVFYSTESLLAEHDGSGKTTGRTYDAGTVMEALDDYRGPSSVRRDKGAWLGYFGGDLNRIVVDKDSMSAEIVITNNEKLTAEFYCTTMDMPEFTVTVTDTAGHKFVKKIDQKDVTQPQAHRYRAVWVLDSLENTQTSFYAQTEGKLLCGTKITVRVDTKREQSGGNILADYAEATTNSLFDDRSDSKTACISYGRHLQNLDNNTSNVLTAVGSTSTQLTEAVQLSDISFRESTDAESYYAVYGDRLFNPIHNTRLVSYQGRKITVDGVEGGTPSISGLHIESDAREDTGLFSSFGGTIQDLLITGPRIKGTANVGTLMGSTTGTRRTEIRNVQVYLYDRLGDTDQKADSVEKVTDWLTGRNVGGLVGSASYNELYIVNSSASLPMEAERYAGGLVGTVNCKTTVLNSYADSYLRGANVGGLIGGAGQRGNIILQNFYAAGYGLASQQAAGLVSFNPDYNPLKTASNGYTVMNLALTKDSTGSVYAAAPRCVSASRTYYLPQTGVDYVPCENTDIQALSYEVLSSDQAFSYERGDGDGGKETVYRLLSPFKRGAEGVTHAYNLMQQGLTGYSYPRLTTTDGKDLVHYGDWIAEFEEGALVYYERDENGRYRFEGGNISIDEIKADTAETDYTKRPKIVADGYALAYAAQKGTDWDGKVTLGNVTDTLKDAQHIVVRNYHLYRLSEKLLNNDSAVSSSSFYETLTVTENGKSRTYSFNPNFASCFGTGAAPEVIRIRSPRQLYALSRLYGTYSGLLSRDTTFRQELDLDYSIYEWSTSYKESTEILEQEPIGSEDNAFFSVYDGRYNTIQGLSIVTEGSQVGLFGKVELSGTVENLVLLGEKARQGKDTLECILRCGGSNSLSVVDGVKTVNMGALVGWNKGSIVNCAVTGYRVSVAAYNGATANIGGLVGRNEGGSIYNSSAESPKLSVRNYSSNTYVGGFVGTNSGSVYNSYAAGYLEVVEAKLETGKNTSRIAGFAARNDSGNLVRCYAGTPLMGSGDTEMYGFAPIGGSVLHCYYLDGGTYEYRGEIYSLNASENGQSRSSKGTAIDADGLKARVRSLSGFGQTESTYLGNADKTYPYPESVTRNGIYLHFGQWPNQDKDIGTFGVFYWEYEQGGNSGYHLTFRGTSDGEPMDGGSTLCQAHDDGGVITEYGYGYFYKPIANDADAKPHLEVESCVLGQEDANASSELHKQMPQYTFVAYKTGTNGLHMTGTDSNRGREANRNAVWKLYYPYVTKGTGVDKIASGVYTYSVSPFFGDAYNLISISRADSADTQTQNGGATPGAEARPYGVRSVDQLQFINWNYWAENATSYISAVSQGNNDSLYNRYPYLSYGKWNTNGNLPSASLDLYWVQSHDVDGTRYQRDYTPIGSMFDDAAASAEAHAIMAFFSSSYDGQAYTVKNIQIDTDAQCIGIFGVTAGAKMKNIVLYSDNGSEIIHKDSKSWYSVGGIAGIAGSMGQSAELSNCTVSGYTIIDRQTTNPGWGGGCVGGLVGTTTMNLTGCTAVSTITLERTYTGSYQNLRVGGLVGCARGKIESCYAGGTISSSNGLGAARIWAGGILGGIVLRNEGNLQTLIGSCDGPTTLTNCYSFVDMSQKRNITAAYAIGSNGEMLEICYPVDYDYIVINNCYAYAGTSQNTDDYIQLKDGRDTYNGINLNRNHPVGISDRTDSFRASMSGKPTVTVYWCDRRVELRNDRNPFLSYKEMKEQLLGFLNGGGASFDTVTVTENSASINGKYSFPGGDKQLIGLDYPFPTILTQVDVSGETVNVHYGAWPKFGIYWEEHKVSMDLIADRNTTGVNLLAAFEGQTEEDNPVSETTVPETTVPETTVPETTVPETTVPETTVPGTTVPETTVPETPVPETTVPETTIPGTTVSETTAPETAVPENKVPERQADETEPQEPEEETAALSAAFQSLDAQSLQAMRYYTLYIMNIGKNNVDGPYFELLDVNGNPISEDDAAAVVLNKTYSQNVESFDVPILAKHPGTVKIRAWVIKDYQDTPEYPATRYEDIMTLTVTADLKITVEEDSLPLKTYEGDPMEDLMITLEDAGGNKFKPGENARLDWELIIDSQESEKNLVTWTPGGFITTKPVPVTGSTQTEDVLFLTSLKGFSPGEGSLKLSLTYTWDAADGVDADPVETSVVIPIEVLPSDVLGLGDGVISKEVQLPHTPPASGTFTGTQRTDTENIPMLEGQNLFLYVSNETNAEGNATSYTDLGAFRVDKVALKQGSAYRQLKNVTPGTGGPTENFAYEAEDGSTILFKITKEPVTAVTGNTRFTYRPIAVEGDGDAQWTLQLTLKPVDEDGNDLNRTYVLEYDRPNVVTFAYLTEDGTERMLKTERVEQGGDLKKLDQDELDEELEDAARAIGLSTAAAPGEHFTWLLPAGAIQSNLTITQTSAPIRYYVSYDAGYEDYEWDDNVPMETDTFTFGQEGKCLKANGYSRPGYTFAGWACAPGSTQVQFANEAEFTEAAIFGACGKTYTHNLTLTLYAVWQPAEYAIHFDADYQGWNAETGGTMADIAYSLATPDRALPGCGFTRTGYDFVGWAFASGKSTPDLAPTATVETAMRRGGEYVIYGDLNLYAVWQYKNPQSQENAKENPEEPIEPTEPTEPTEPSEPTEPTEPTEPSEPTEETTAPTQAPTQAPTEEAAEDPEDLEKPAGDAE